MIFLGDYFALCLVAILCMFFFDRKATLRNTSRASKLFILSLLFTAMTAGIDLLGGQLLGMENVPVWQNMLVNELYFVINIITTSCIAQYLFTKILEHTHSRHCMKRALTGLGVLFIVYMLFVITNIWTGWLFYFDENGQYCRGPLNVLGYVVTLLQMVLVLICYFRNKKNASRPMRRVLLLSFPIVVLYIIVQRTFPEVMLNGFIMAQMDVILFLTFQGQRQGVHSLTELNDRHRFFNEVDRRIAAEEPFQIFLINIKNFGSINQKFGHVFGDELLYHFAFALDTLLNKSVSYHMNGTVFATVLPYTYQITAEKQSGKLLDFLEQGIECMSRNIQLEYVVVDYVSDGLENSAAEVYENLEYAGSRAYGLNHRYIRYTNEIGTVMSRRRYLRDRIRVVDRSHGFEVWYQPIQCMATSRFCSMEALIRLREPDGSLISPAEFIPLAEETGHISPITWFVLEETCQMLKSTPELKDVSVSINLPMTQLLEKGFIPRFTGIVDQAGVEHRQICIEFTERAILENFHQTKEIMQQLTENGFRFYLDDFGAGYSNFNCLLQLPFQIIKLDACLTKPVREGRNSEAIVDTLTKIFHEMKLTVIAEGAETQGEVDALRAQGVDRIQGYALARPMPIAKLVEFYQEHPL